MNLLAVEGLFASYSGIKALRDVWFTIDQGEMVALIGPNGAGKSTLLNCISGILKPDSGLIKFNGKSIVGIRAAQISRLGVAQVPEGRQVLADLTVEENLLLGKLAGRDRAAVYDIDYVYELFPILVERRSQLAGLLSGGQQQMLVLGRALMGSPSILMLDEPSLGLAPLVAKHVFDALAKLNAEGLTIFLVEQNARRALQISSRAIVLERGAIVATGQSSALLTDPKIIEHYLGVRPHHV